MTTHQDIEQAIHTLKSQQAILGDMTVHIATTALQEKLETLSIVPDVEQYDQVTVLVADLSNFTAISAMMDAEELGDTMNAVWRKLDAVIEAWGGRIDKHTGDGLIALFGVGEANDAECAVLAALDMQLELAIFNEMARERTQETPSEWVQLLMRIGLHTGPVAWGKVGASHKYTAIGETVTVATQLEELAPVEKILISERVRFMVEDVVSLTLFDSVTVAGQNNPSDLFVIQEGQQRPFHLTKPPIPDISTRMIGRDDELGHLQLVLQSTVDSRLPQVVLIIGEQGIGKARLLDEFVPWLTLLPEKAALFWGKENKPTPYAFMQTMMLNYFTIDDRSSFAVQRLKWIRGFTAVLGDTDGRQVATLIGQLLGLAFIKSPHTDETSLWSHALQGLKTFFTALATQFSVVSILVANIHATDHASLKLLAHLIAMCDEIPLLFIGSAWPSFLVEQPLWANNLAIDDLLYHRLDLKPLSSINSRHLVTEILQKVNNLPIRLIDFIVSGAQGNPQYIEEVIKTLITEKVIDVEGEWRLQLANLSKIRLPLTLSALLASRP